MKKEDYNLEEVNIGVYISFIFAFIISIGIFLVIRNDVVFLLSAIVLFALFLYISNWLTMRKR